MIYEYTYSNSQTISYRSILCGKYEHTFPVIILQKDISYALDL